MNKIRIFLLLIASLMLLNSCNFFHFALASVKKKRSEPIQECNKFLQKRGFDTAYSYKFCENCIDSLSFKKYAINTYKLNTGSKASPVQIRMYRPDGQYISGWENCYGDLKYFHFMDSIPFKRFFNIPINNLVNLNSDLSLLKINNKDKLYEEIKSSNYVILVYWAKFAGYYSKSTLRFISKYYTKYKDKYKIVLIFANTSK